jgi:hypothetical protein
MAEAASSPGMGEAEIEALDVDRFDGLEARVAPLAHAVAHEPRAQHRQQVSVTISEPTSAKTMVSAIGLNSVPGRPGQDIDRQEAGHDHRDGIEQRPIHLRRRVPDDLPDVERRSLAQRDLAEDVFHHHHRAIHQDAEIDRADGQQVGRGVLQVETDEREQQRQRNGGGDDQAGAKIVEEEDQDTTTSNMPRSRLSSTTCVVSAIRSLRS